MIDERKAQQMNLQAATEPVPMAADSDGTIRIGGTRVTLDNLMAHFEAGATPEEIVEQLDTLSLADVYFVRGYCLRHSDDVREYLRERSERADRIRAEIEADSGSVSFVRNIVARADGR